MNNNLYSFITKEKSQMIYGVAVILMVIHHLFGFPERIHNDYILILDSKIINIETMITYFGRICISTYSFISGYGLVKKIKNMHHNISLKIMYSMIFKQLLKFYLRVWIVFITFIPYGIYMDIFKFERKTFLLNFFGIVATYNLEWWYIKQYVLMLLMFPITYVIIQFIDKKINNAGIIGIIIIILITAGIYTNYLSEFWSYFMSFVIGMLFSDHELYYLIDVRKYSGVSAVCILCIVFLARTLFLGSGKYDYLLVPFFIFGICKIIDFKIFPKIGEKILTLCGKYSIYIWLTHTFFIYYYFSKIIYSFKYSIFIYIWTFVICLVTGFLLNIICEKIWTCINQRLIKNEEKIWNL